MRKTHAREAAQIAQQSATLAEAQAYPSITAMVEDPSIDALWICGPNHARVENISRNCYSNRRRRDTWSVLRVRKAAGEKRRRSPPGRGTRLKEAGLLHGYLEDQLFSDSVSRGKEILWRRGARLTGPPVPGSRSRGTQRPAHALVLAGQRFREAACPQRHDVPFDRSGALSAD